MRVMVTSSALFTTSQDQSPDDTKEQSEREMEPEGTPEKRRVVGVAKS